MAIGISVDGTSVAAYACNGINDEAWFFGDTKGGAIDLNSKFRDRLQANTTGSELTGELTMNGITYPFTAVPVTGAAGMYTAAVNDTRSSWIVRPDGSVTAVKFDVGVSNRRLEQAKTEQLDAATFQAQVRDTRVLTPADTNVRVADGKLTSEINGTDVVGVLVTGTFRLA